MAIGGGHSVVIEIKSGWTITLDFETMEILIQDQSRQIIPINGFLKYDVVSLLSSANSATVAVRFKKLVELIAAMHGLRATPRTDNPKFLQFNFCEVQTKED